MALHNLHGHRAGCCKWLIGGHVVVVLRGVVGGGGGGVSRGPGSNGGWRTGTLQFILQ